MRRPYSARREFWISVGGSLLFHAVIFCFFLGWPNLGETPPAAVDVEWTWAAPSNGQIPDRPKEATATGSGSIRTTEKTEASAGGNKLESSPAASRKKSSDVGVRSTTAGSTGSAIPDQARGAAQGSKPPISATGRQDIAGGGSSPAQGESNLPGFGDSTGYALVPPRLKERPPLLLPPDALTIDETREVLLLVEVMENGRVGKISVSRSSGVKALDDAARENVAHWRFEPAWQPQGKKPVRVMTAVWIRYTKEGR